jgi:hypothetical protein
MQLSFLESTSVVLEYHPSRQPPDATGPSDHGAYSATLGGHRRVDGWGRTEHRAIVALARRLHDEAETTTGDRLTGLGQALSAAEYWPLPVLVEWLTDRAAEPQLVG